jgi:hypothetical protein
MDLNKRGFYAYAIDPNMKGKNDDKAQRVQGNQNRLDVYVSTATQKKGCEGRGGYYMSITACVKSAIGLCINR